jgi:hypothetical protein
MQRYAPKAMELAPRDIVSRCIQTEINEGRGFDHPLGKHVHLDLRHLGAQKILERLPGIRNISIDFLNIDPIREPIPIQPGQHYSMGGIDVNARCASEIRGFYAGGECSCVSVHGANRLGGNSLLETIVFGKLAAQAIHEDMAKDPLPLPDERPLLRLQDEVEAKIGRLTESGRTERAYRIHAELGAMMSEKVGIFRTREELDQALGILLNLKARYGRVGVSSKTPLPELRADHRPGAGIHAGGGPHDHPGGYPPRGKPGGSLPARIPSPERQGLAEAHHRTDRPGRTAGHLLQGGGDDAVPAHGEKVLIKASAYTFKILRYDAREPETEPRFATYRISVIPGLTVLAVLLRIRDEIDGTLAFRSSCRSAVCGSCAMVINGKIDLACRTQVAAFNTDTIVLEPLPNFEVLKDLVVDMTPFWRMYEKVKPYLIRESPPPRRRSPECGGAQPDRPVRQLHPLCLLLRGLSGPGEGPRLRRAGGGGQTRTLRPSIPATRGLPRSWSASTTKRASGPVTQFSAASTPARRTSGPPTPSWACARLW